MDAPGPYDDGWCVGQLEDVADRAVQHRSLGRRAISRPAREIEQPGCIDAGLVVAEAQRRCEGFDTFLPGSIGGVLIVIRGGTPGPRQRDDDAELRARLVAEGHVLLVLSRNHCTVRHAREIAFIVDQVAGRVVAMLSAVFVPIAALAGRRRRQMAVAGRGDRTPGFRSNSGMDLLQRCPAVAVEERDVDLVGVVFVAAGPAKHRRDDARARLGADLMRRQFLDQRRPGQGLPIDPRRRLGVMAESAGIPSRPVFSVWRIYLGSALFA
jgi:hypothetical protein